MFNVTSEFCCGCVADRRKLHNEDLNDLYSSPDIVRVIRS